MNTTHTDLTEGARADITVEFLTRRTTRGENRVHRLLVEDEDDTRFAILVDPNSGLLPGLKTGRTYRFSGLLASAPAATNGGTEEECPGCGGELRRGTVADAIDPEITEAAAELGVDQRFGIVDEHTTTRRGREHVDRVDDWQPMTDDDAVVAPDYVCPSCDRQFDWDELHRYHGSGGRGHRGEVLENVAPESPMVDAAAATDTVGLAAGGATDVTNFRENVENGYTPRPEAISDEGLFYDYSFETGERADTDALFAPRYAAAASTHPLTGETERYLSVGLDSALAVEDFRRPDLDLVAVLDVSGSMDSRFDEYYYDERGRRRETDADARTKLEAATQSLCALTEHLHPDDRLGVVLYNHRAHVAKPLRDVGATDMNAIRRHIRDVSAGGSTNLADGFEAAVDLLAGDPRHADVERRVIFLTDMMPNDGATNPSELTRLFAEAADDGVHTTFVGMGIDENAELADALSGIRGANHYFVQSAAEFERRLGEEFDYMVAPLVYDLSLELEGDGYEIAAVHGSPSAEDPADRLLHVGTLFPSAKRDGKARGGVVLVELERTAPDGNPSLVASWTERDGSDHAERVAVALPDNAETYAHDGIRKAIALARYADELRSWTHEVHERANRASGVDDWLLPGSRGEHERESVPLVVPAEHAERFRMLRGYLREEINAIGDEALQRELDLLKTLCAEQPERPREVTD
ncbi:vWA domain-containing protein [Halobellus rarus]|uniref:VWA domain-containing protein n=1 Tax=Halobellus rarus TaxID=1126237 RepID=A0ABD6CPN2_9EURY|nr:VWA domain-containing protein [Halobellus rarus]